MTTRFNQLITILIASSLGGCFYFEKSIYTICDETPDICTDIKTKGWCKEERTQLIRTREKQILAPDDQENLYRNLINWKSFSACIEVASQIKRRSLTDRNSTKAATFVHSIMEIQKLENQTKNSNYPHLLYYHWTQYGDDEKIEKLKVLDKNGKLNTSELQFKMASYYSKRDRSKFIKAQYSALSLLTKTDLESLDHDVFASIATYYFQMDNLKKSYIWSQVAVKFGLKANAYSSLTGKLNRQGIDLSVLDLKAKAIYKSINELNFSL